MGKKKETDPAKKKAPAVGAGAEAGSENLIQNSGEVEKTQEKFNFKDIAVKDSFDTEFVEVRTFLAVRKPKNTEWFRVNPVESYMGDVPCLEIPQVDGFGKDKYIVYPDVLGQLNLVEYPVNVQRLYTCVNSNGVPFLWSIKLPQPGMGWHSWNLSAEKIAQEAKNKWVRSYSIKSEARYGMLVNTNFEKEPVWPEETFDELVEIAFSEFFIRSIDHPVLQNLRGEAGG